MFFGLVLLGGHDSVWGRWSRFQLMANHVYSYIGQFNPYSFILQETPAAEMRDADVGPLRFLAMAMAMAMAAINIDMISSKVYLVRLKKKGAC